MSDLSLFKWRHFQADIILCAVRWYLRYALSYRDVEELLRERGVWVDHTTVFRWVQRYAPELGERCCLHLKTTNSSCRVDETSFKVKSCWSYLYHTVESTGATIDFLLSTIRDTRTATQFSVEPWARRMRQPFGSLPSISRLCIRQPVLFAPEGFPSETCTLRSYKL